MKNANLQGGAAASSSSRSAANNKSGAIIDLKKRATPRIHQQGPEIQKFGERIKLPLGLPDEVCRKSIAVLNQVLAETMTLRDMYKKHHWQVGGLTFYQLHLLYDKHYEEQSALVDKIAERIQTLGGISIAMSADIAEMTTIARPPKGREEVPTQISRLLDAHEIIFKQARKGASDAEDAGDDGTNDLLVSDIIRTNELQVWFIAEHLAPEHTLSVS